MNSSGPKKLRILYIGLMYDYGVPERGYSFEYVNFFDTLSRMEGADVKLFPYDKVMREMGRQRMNEMLVSTIREYKPEACFFVLFTDEIQKEKIRYITEASGAVTFNWFGDDHWRFSPYSKYWAPLFHWVITTDKRAVEKYHANGCRQVLLSQWAFNHHHYRSFELPQEYDITFVGQVHSHRRKVIRRLRKEGIDVECWGKGWARGRLSQETMVQMYSRSKINLNFTESSPMIRWKPAVKVFLTRRADGTVRVNSVREVIDNVVMLAGVKHAQIKGRNFEIPGSGGFLLTEYADGIEEYFTPGTEIAVFRNGDELIDSVRYFLNHDEEREAIRRAGHRRAQLDHTFENRFRKMFQEMKLTQ